MYQKIIAGYSYLATSATVCGPFKLSIHFRVMVEEGNNTSLSNYIVQPAGRPSGTFPNIPCVE